MDKKGKDSACGKATKGTAGGETSMPVKGEAQEKKLRRTEKEKAACMAKP